MRRDQFEASIAVLEKHVDRAREIEQIKRRIAVLYNDLDVLVPGAYRRKAETAWADAHSTTFAITTLFHEIQQLESRMVEESR